MKEDCDFNNFMGRKMLGKTAVTRKMQGWRKRKLSQQRWLSTQTVEPRAWYHTCQPNQLSASGGLCWPRTCHIYMNHYNHFCSFKWWEPVCCRNEKVINCVFDFSCKVISPTQRDFIWKACCLQTCDCAKGKKHIPLGASKNQPQGKTTAHNNGILEGTKARHLTGLATAVLKREQDQELQAIWRLFSFGPVPFSKAFFNTIFFLVLFFFFA